MNIKPNNRAGLTLLGLIVAIVIIIAVAAGVVYVGKRIVDNLNRLFPRGYDPEEQAYKLDELPEVTDGSFELSADLPQPTESTTRTLEFPDRKTYQVELSPYATGPWFPAMNGTIECTPAEAQSVLHNMLQFDLLTGTTNRQMFWRARVVSD